MVNNNPDKQYLVATTYGDGSHGRKVMTWAEIQAMSQPMSHGFTIRIEEL